MLPDLPACTKTYNRFHDPDERDTQAVKLRELHAAMDRAVLDVYRCSDIPTDCEFLLDFEICLPTVEILNPRTFAMFAALTAVSVLATLYFGVNAAIQIIAAQRRLRAIKDDSEDIGAADLFDPLWSRSG